MDKSLCGTKLYRYMNGIEMQLDQWNRDAIGSRMDRKLRFEHIYLNPNSGMRVNLAGQVRIGLLLFCYC